jgi:hypothetical protein
MREQNCSLYDALVFDTQGSELLVLRGAAPLLQNFKFILSEVADFESYTGCARLSEMTKFLGCFGFQQTACLEQTRHSNGGRYYDALFERA